MYIYLISIIIFCENILFNLKNLSAGRSQITGISAIGRDTGELVVALYTYNLCLQGLFVFVIPASIHISQTIESTNSEGKNTVQTNENHEKDNMPPLSSRRKHYAKAYGFTSDSNQWQPIFWKSDVNNVATPY